MSVSAQDSLNVVLCLTSAEDVMMETVVEVSTECGPIEEESFPIPPECEPAAKKKRGGQFPINTSWWCKRWVQEIGKYTLRLTTKILNMFENDADTVQSMWLQSNLFSVAVLHGMWQGPLDLKNSCVFLNDRHLLCVCVCVCVFECRWTEAKVTPTCLQWFLWLGDQEETEGGQRFVSARFYHFSSIYRGLLSKNGVRNKRICEKIWISVTDELTFGKIFHHRSPSVSWDRLHLPHDHGFAFDWWSQWESIAADSLL